MMKAFPQISWNEYLYERSYAQLQIMSVDSTHTKYLYGIDKKIWENYQEIIKAQQAFERFLSGGNKEKDNNE